MLKGDFLLFLCCFGRPAMHAQSILRILGGLALQETIHLLNLGHPMP